MPDRLSFGFHNPNHAAALACAFLPLCWGWRRAAWAGRTLSAALFAAVLLTQSRTGIIVAALEWAAWRLLSAWSGRDACRQSAPKGAPSRRHVSASAALRLMAPPLAVAAMDTMFAAKFGRDVDVSVGLVAVTTLLSILTMPLLVGFAMWAFR